MPSLSDTLDKLAHESEQISRYASENDRPPGPFTAAFLYLPTRDNPNPNILSLIRDSDESERRPFRDVNEEEYLNVGPSAPGPRKSMAVGAQANGRGHLLTPLPDLQRKRNTAGELEATLAAAEKVAESLADSSWRMSRAQDRVQTLLEQHRRQVARIAEVERLIAEVQAPTPVAEQPPSPTPAKKELPPRPVLSIDDAIKAEEEALKVLEGSIAPLRRAAALRASAQRSPKASPGKSPFRGPRSPQAQTTPRAAPRTPAAMPVITNSLVQGTPRDHHGSRFSPLHLLGTPGAPLPPGSALRNTGEPRSIFGPPRKTITPSRHIDNTLLTPAPIPPPTFSLALPSPEPAPAYIPDPTPVKAVPEPEPEPTPARPRQEVKPSTPGPAPTSGPRMVEGVEVDLECVGKAVVSHRSHTCGANFQDKIWDTLPDLMEMDAGGGSVQRSPDSTV